MCIYYILLPNESGFARECERKNELHLKASPFAQIGFRSPGTLQKRHTSRHQASGVRTPSDE
jgi:hypothetical protein